VRVDFGLVKGKSNPLLKKVDRTAKEAARSGMAVDRGYRPGKIGRPKTKGGGSTMFPADGQALVIRVYGSRLVGRTGENRVTFEIYDEATNQYGAKHFAYATPEVGSELHRQRLPRADERQPQVSAGGACIRGNSAPESKETGQPMNEMNFRTWAAR